MLCLAAAMLLSACVDSSSPAAPERSTVPMGTEAQPEEILSEPETDIPLLAEISPPLSLVHC